MGADGGGGVDFRTYLRNLRRRWVVLLVAVIAATTAAGIIDVVRPATYEAAGRVALAAPVEMDEKATRISERYIHATRAAFAKLAYTPEILSPAAAQLAGTATPASVEEGMSAFARQREPQLEVRVRDADPRFAAEAVNALLNRLAFTIPRVSERPVEAVIEQRADVPSRAIAPNVPLDLASGALVGLGGGMIFVWFVSRRRRTTPPRGEGRG